MDLNLKDKVAVVTGASKGIGLAVAQGLAEEGARVVTASRTVTPELAELRDTHGATVVTADLSVPQGAADLVRAATDAHGGIDILVNNAAASRPAPDFVGADDAAWRRVFDLNLFGVVRVTRAAIPVMTARGGGAIVNVSSINARMPAPSIVHYSASKAALTNVGRALAEELGASEIRVNTVSPGPVRTPMWTAKEDGFANVFAAQAGITVEEVMDRLLPETFAATTGRISEPREVADVVIFLASPRAGNITGSDYVIDGGVLKTA
ncbi:SDR family NAD(P)-dependent oxidoreductase [Streptomonospora nanhaiensis]|uniref:SDR family NAD(P)-dependent oxidoreductase n=1 Tax=Streptomonospora nanhaiensis TaxID=1323731 RepID=UPI001C37FD85|nr:oxidoreductase [Streptomonospora nanhaiensis]MBV2363425.1 SDR family oxidoreductase [Streptomonospora nanhaiensis]